MKLNQLSVIFVIIIVPLALVLSMYVGNLIDVTAQQSQYDSLLLNSTYDAVRAYQLTTLNNNYGGQNASKERDIEASVNSFFNSLAEGMQESGYTKEELNSYIPSMLYSMYNGYYIYGPYDNSVTGLAYTGEAIYNTKGTETKNTEYGVKPFSYYTCEYQKSSDYDIIINYTLDNYISVMGSYEKGGETHYIAKSGYYINTNKYDKNTSSRTITVKATRG